MSNKSRCRRSPDQRRHRCGATATRVGIAVAGAMAAALPAAANDDYFTELVEAIDPNAFTSAGAANDIIGIVASEIDSDLTSTVFGPELNTIADQIIAIFTTVTF